MVTDELKQRILKYMGTVSKAKNRDVARAIGVEKSLVDKALGELAKEDKIEYQGFGGITYVVLKGKQQG
jgi:Mn-dependent DtxR family transcriptional regulator